MSVAAIITQARTTSTRLPRKVLRTVGGKTLLDIHLDRLVASGLPVLIATTTNSMDDEIAALGSRRGIAVYRGSEMDVLGRFAGCAAEHALDTVVRVTSDCPLIDGALIAEGVDLYAATADPHLYLSNTLERTFPRGLDFEIFSAAALYEADREAAEKSAREHVTPFLYQSPGRRLLAFTRADDRSRYRLTVDTEPDLELVRILVEEHSADCLSAEDLIDLLDRHPDLAAINEHVEQKKLGQ